MREIDNCYAELFGAIWSQAVQDDVKIHTDKSLEQIQWSVLDEANEWKIRYTMW